MNSIRSIASFIFVLSVTLHASQENFTDTTIEQKPKLIYEYASSVNLMSFNLKDTPYLEASHEYHQNIDLSNLNIYAWIKKDSLKINVDIDRSQERKSIEKIRKIMPWPITIKDPQQYKWYPKLLELTSKDDFYESTDFKNPKTIQLYNLGKNLLTLWAEARKVRITTITEITNENEIEQLSVFQNKQPIDAPLISHKNTPTDKKTTANPKPLPPISQKPLSFFQRWTSGAAWSSWFQQQKTKIYNTLGFAALIGGGAGLWYWSQKNKNSSLPSLNSTAATRLYKP